MAELFGGLCEPLVEQLGVFAQLGGLAESLLAVGDHQENDTADAAGHGERDLDQVELVRGRWRLLAGQPGEAPPPQQPSRAGHHRDAEAEPQRDVPAEPQAHGARGVLLCAD
ncbi:hypothetical protein F0L68_07380 [Solihabitans fulvus]|uniref:Uncharacterized protein n=1 Tax=Solihabitans fulvus TaxID=1892852 RepID=A0A5B2XNE5_9PSEU|nr:hypothetical protein [Solihabitans fulvus]KAA2264886.1 hypothetical protein F0L68_07380 [Solihabitans fulvus]